MHSQSLLDGLRALVEHLDSAGERQKKDSVEQKISRPYYFKSGQSANSSAAALGTSRSTSIVQRLGISNSEIYATLNAVGRLRSTRQ